MKLGELERYTGYSARIIEDSRNDRFVRLTSMEIRYPRFVHSEFMTHRVFSRNAASSRAIPIATILKRVEEDPVLPVWWGRNQAGMQAHEELVGESLALAKERWLAARDSALQHARELAATGLHKQLVNRILEPWMWITVIVTATDWENFFAQRCHPDAQPELRHVADMMHRAYYFAPEPRKLRDGEWHLPYLPDRDEVDPKFHCAVSVGRCARVSYLTHDGKRDPLADVARHDRLKAQIPGHWSPFEHVARAESDVARCRNFRGFVQYRAMEDFTSVQT